MPPPAGSRLDIRLLGGFDVRVDGRAAAGFESRKARALLALLATPLDRPLARDRAIALLWPDIDDDAGRQNLRQALYNVRATLRDAVDLLEVGPQDLRLRRTDAVIVDVAHFEAAAEAGLALEGVRSLTTLGAALDLYRGDFLDGLTVRDADGFEEWQERERERLRTLAITAGRAAVARAEGAGEHEAGLRFANRLEELDPLSEEAVRASMRMLARLGLRPQAMLQFEALRKRLERDLGVAPASDIVEMARVLRQEPASSLETHLGPAAAAPASPIVPFVGRDEPMRALSRMWREAAHGSGRVTALVGPGGIGKTRLARTFLGRAARGLPAVVLQGRAGPAETPTFREVVAEALASLAPAALDEASPELARARQRATAAMPELAKLRPDLYPAVAESADDWQEAAAALAVALANPVARRRPDWPVTFFLDDLDRVPEAHQGIAGLSRRTAGAAVWWIGAWREAPGASVPDAAALAAAGAERLELQPFAEHEMRSIAHALVGEAGSERLVALFVDVGGELPLAIAEAVNLLADEGRLRPRGGVEWALEGDLPRLPRGADALIYRRVERLTTASRRLLSRAAVLGERFDAEALRLAEGEHPRVFEAALEILVERWFVRPVLRSWVATRRERDMALWASGTRRGRFEFSQRTVRQTVLDRMDPARRRGLERAARPAGDVL